MSTLLIVLIAYLILNLVVFVSFGWDKRKAEKGKWRTRESTLLALGFIGPWGAIAGMKTFHHKTQKNKFKWIYIFAAIHVAVVCYILIR